MFWSGLVLSNFACFGCADFVVNTVSGLFCVVLIASVWFVLSVDFTACCLCGLTSWFVFGRVLFSFVVAWLCGFGLLLPVWCSS